MSDRAGRVPFRLTARADRAAAASATGGRAHDGTRSYAATIAHRRFADLPDFVRPGDLLVLNNTRVPARRFSDDGRIEFLFLEQSTPRPGDVSSNRDAKCGSEPWPCSTHRGVRWRKFSRKVSGSLGSNAPSIPVAEAKFHCRLISTGRPTKKTRRVIKRFSPGSPAAVAAPTAGFISPRNSWTRLPHTFVTLHVGDGHFSSGANRDDRRHRMHAERFTITESRRRDQCGREHSGNRNDFGAGLGGGGETRGRFIAQEG